MDIIIMAIITMGIVMAAIIIIIVTSMAIRVITMAIIIIITTITGIIEMWPYKHFNPDQ